MALVWPLLFFLLERKRRQWRFVWIVYLVELLLCGGTIYWLYVFTTFGHWLYGAYVVAVAIAIHALTSIFLLIDRFRSRPA